MGDGLVIGGVVIDLTLDAQTGFDLGYANGQLLSAPLGPKHQDFGLAQEDPLARLF